MHNKVCVYLYKHFTKMDKLVYTIFGVGWAKFGP